MKINRIIPIILSFVIIISCTCPAYAVNNTIKGQSTDSDTLTVANANGNGPSIADIQSTGDQNNITLPTKYCSDYKIKFITPSKGNYVYIHKSLDRNTDPKTLQPNGYEGTEAIVLADDTSAGYSCIIYRSDDNKLHTGWIPDTFLSSHYPGNNTFSNMSARLKDYPCYREDFIDADWSGDYFVGTKTKYIIPDRTRRNIISLTLNYQIYAKNGIYNCAGMRDVYYNDGEGWEYVGSFDVDSTLPSVQYTMNFASPVTVEAVAVIPQDTSSQGFLFNLFIDHIHIVEY